MDLVLEVHERRKYVKLRPRALAIHTENFIKSLSYQFIVLCLNLQSPVETLGNNNKKETLHSDQRVYPVYGLYMILEINSDYLRNSSNHFKEISI